MAKAKAVEMTMEKMPNTLHLDENELPEIKDWKVGEKYQILLDVEQTGLHKGDMMASGPKGNFSADFKIIKASMPNEESTEEEAKESPEVETKESPKVAEALRRKFTK